MEDKDSIALVQEGKSKKNEVLYQFVTFKLGTEDYAVSIEHVKEVTITPKISKMPKTPPFIKGVASVRGDLIAIVDLEERFDLKPALKIKDAPIADSFTIVIDADTYTIGFIVTEMPNTLVLSESQINRSADVIEKARLKNKFISGLGKTNDGDLVILLDILKVLSAKEISQISSV
ncbi:Positive regulator of CheA protein activity (CheW) [Fulvivirga imtechensis AK7]|uniref:Positive regulator of CheA protein activity (CheW) n=1 Tax=Fulvivirga imtechensis AK7 TaxID=1237149 RepID=L8JQG4_9BACT|nr:chemotaxis protein CheW [Fulvivirga imtechensis]ELR69709.1 Positive regulator of CheA protein activity (CheW) [Fulvivirga imtechensis AK7]